MDAFVHGDLQVEPGTVGRGTLGEVRLPAGRRIELPLIVVHGVAEGPTLAVTAAVHGNEVVGIGAALSLVRTLDPQNLRGTVVLVPAVNLPAVEAASYLSPVDGVNMAGPIYWDARAGGSTSQRLGALVGSVLERADYYIDLHGNLEPSSPMSMLFLDNTRDEDVRKATVELATAFGVTPVDMSEPEAHPAWLGPPDVYPAATALARGIPALMVELDQARTMEDAPRGCRGLLSVLRTLDMIDTSSDVAPDPTLLPGTHRYWGALESDVAGLLWIRHPAGQPFEEGVLLAEITDVFGEVQQQLHSPVAGFCWWYPGTSYGMATHAVPAGSTVALIARSIEAGR